jgi:hypothetical protein
MKELLSALANVKEVDYQLKTLQIHSLNQSILILNG